MRTVILQRFPTFAEASAQESHNMDALLPIPYLARIVISLFAILVFQKLTKRLDVAMILGTCLLALWTGQTASSSYHIAYNRIVSPDMLFLACVIAGVIWLSTLLSHAGVMKELVDSLRPRLSKRTILAALPAVVGLLPMPAGALFSCPLVDDADSDHQLSQKLKTEINYWFRHLWEFWWPLYPGVLLATDLSKLAIWKFVLLMLPLFFASIAAGYIFLLRQVPQAAPVAGDGARKPFLPLIAPTITVIAVYGFILVFFPAVGAFNRYLPMAIGVLCAHIVLQIQHPASMQTLLKTVFSPKSFALVLIIVLARVYGAFIEAELPSGVHLMDTVRGELASYGIPPLVLVILIPFISGLTTGITVGYIGASFPVVLSLAGSGTGGFFSTIIIGYTCGFLGMMLSPIHVCLIVTNEYFKTTAMGSISSLLRPAALLFACAAVYAGLWYWLG